MTIPLEIPEELARLFGGSEPELSRRALEAMVLESYRQERIGGPQAAKILGMSRLGWEQFPDDHHVFEGAYTAEDLDRAVATFRQLRAEGKLRPV